VIYLITGVPGSGKTLYAVSTLIQKLLKEKLKLPGGKMQERRLVVDGIPDLVINHEIMAPRGEASFSHAKGKEVEPENEGHGLWNWWEWAKAGDILVCDEVQRHWRPRGLGTKPPEEITKLEVHRHYGVDFVIISQNPMLIDQNVRRLVGRHIHVRRLFGGSRALIYDWDGCQADTQRTQGATRTVWNYPKKAFAYYKSSELHTKQQQKIPLFLAFPLVVVAIAAVFGPKAWDVMHRTTSGKSLASASAGATKPAVAALAPAHAAASESAGGVAPVASVGAGAVPADGEEEAPEVAGCVVVRGECRCVDGDGGKVDVPQAQCMDRVPTGVPIDLAKFVPNDVLERPRDADRDRAAADLAMFARSSGPHRLVGYAEVGVRILGSTR
jgi:zona occludens toxin